MKQQVSLFLIPSENETFHSVTHILVIVHEAVFDLKTSAS